MKSSWKFTAVHMAGLTMVMGMTLATPAHAQSADVLLAKHDSLKGDLASSPFQRPLLLQSNTDSGDPHGDVYAVVEHPFGTVTTALERGNQWCDVLMLQTNVKACAASGAGADQSLRVAIVRKLDQTVKDAYPIEFKYAVQSADANYLSVRMAADAGPLGTRNYRLEMEAVPIDAKHSFIHMSYSYANGMAAKLATDAYLATSGRDKVGFSVTGKDDAGKATYVNGIRGVAERNTMRYFLAIESVLGTTGLPADQRADKRRRSFFAAIERYPRQLKEMELGQYLAMKQREAKPPAEDGAS